MFRGISQGMPPVRAPVGFPLGGPAMVWGERGGASKSPGYFWGSPLGVRGSPSGVALGGPTGLQWAVGGRARKSR